MEPGRQLERKVVPFEARAATADGAEFEGYAACFHNIDAYGDIIAAGAFRETLSAFLADGIVAWQHDWAEPIGRPLEAREDGRGLYTRARISDTARGRDARTLIRDGVVRKLSIGFRTIERRWLETREAVEAYWAEAGYTPTAADLDAAERGARLLTRIRLYEISPVSIAANPECDLAPAKAGPLRGDPSKEGPSGGDPAREELSGGDPARGDMWAAGAGGTGAAPKQQGMDAFARFQAITARLNGAL